MFWNILKIVPLRYDELSDTAAQLEQALNLLNVFPSNKLYNILKSCEESAGLHQNVLRKFSNTPPLGPQLEVQITYSNTDK